MPSSLHPQAKFDPLPPDLDLSALVEKTSNFDYVIRISVDQIIDLTEFEHLILIHVIIGGRPLVIEGWNNKLPPWLFSPTWLQDNVSKKEEKVRDIGNGVDIPMTIGHYLGSLDKLNKQWTPTNFRDPKRQRLYLKDIDCPEAWHQHLRDFIPQNLFYLNDCVGDKGGPGALHERNMYNQLVLGKGIGPAGDLMSSLPPDMRAENLMCYIGHEGTYTPAHREMCASLGQNIMIEASSSDNGESPGSSIWFMTESKDREVVSEYFLSMLGHDIEVENHFAQINAWKKAPFPVYIVEQKVGDFILVPPLAPHQVWNRGTRTMKAAWNRTTVETLELAIHEALPRARMVCRDEQYKNKAIIYYSLLRYFDQLQKVEQAGEGSWHEYSKEPIGDAIRVKQLKKDFKRLFALYTEILISETFSLDLPKEKNVEFIPFDSNITCSYCRCNIFNRFLTCKTCVGEVEITGDEDTYDICMECYAMGRSCACISGLKWVEQWQWPVLLQHHEQWRAMVISNDGLVDADSSPQALGEARVRYGKKPVAQVCQEQLKLRPWHDITSIDGKELSPRTLESDPEPEVDEEGRRKKKRFSRRKSGPQKKNHTACHICKHQERNWKLAFCTTCTNAYCYGSLWRAFDLKPQTIMENADWQCPKCLNVCSCGKCRRDPSQNAYRPKGTLLGHDTRKVADPRSVESLVDFSRTNLTWLRGEGDDDPQSSQRMQKLVQKAQADKARDEVLEQEIVASGNLLQQDSYESVPESNMVIDPLLRWGEFDITGAVAKATGTPILNLTGDIEGDTAGRLLSLQGGIENNKLNHTDNRKLSGNHVVAAANIAAPESRYPDPSGLGRDRMMGMGYYQQANDADKILFDHPDTSTPADQNTDLAYPRLPQDPNQPGSYRKDRRLKNDTKGKANEAHAEFAQALKRQKIAQSKNNGTFIMTRNKLEGGGPLIIKLPLWRSKDFLRTLNEPDTGTHKVRRNPRSSRPSISHHPEIGADTSRVTPGNSQDVGGSISCEISDDDDNHMFFAKEFIHQVRKETSGLIEPMDVKRSGPAKRMTRLLDIDNVMTKGSVGRRSKVSQIMSEAIPRSRGKKPSRDRHSSATYGPRDVISLQQPLGAPSLLHQASLLSRYNIVGADVLPAGTSQSKTKTQSSISLRKAVPSSPSNSSPSMESDYETAILVDDDYRPLRPGAVNTIDKEYLNAKMEALREIEAEMGADVVGNSKRTDLELSSKHNQASIKSVATKSPANGQESYKVSPPKLLSMADRQGKAVKIVSRQASAGLRSVSRAVSAAQSQRKSLPPATNIHKSLGNGFDGHISQDSLSSDDDDDSIPAVRPAAPKPRSATSSGLHNSKAGINMTEKPAGMLDGLRNGKSLFRTIK